MLILVALASQAMSGSVLPSDPRLRIAPSCPPANSTGDDIVVCGHADSNGDRLKPLPPRYKRGESGPPRAALTVPGLGELSAEGEQGSTSGIPSPRAMVRLTIPF